VSFTAQVPSWAEWAPPISVLCLGHSVGSGFLCRNDILILSANPELKIVCRIGREATQIGCWSEQIPSEIVIKIVDKSCPSPLWWAAIRHSGRVSNDEFLTGELFLPSHTAKRNSWTCSPRSTGVAYSPALERQGHTIATSGDA